MGGLFRLSLLVDDGFGLVVSLDWFLICFWGRDCYCFVCCLFVWW